MSMLGDYSAFASAAARFHLQNPDLAPDAGRKLVEIIAAGFAHTIGERQFCTLCQHEIDGAQGHTISCPTMLARRILANEAVQPARPVLDAPVLRRVGALPALPVLPQPAAPGVDIDAVHARRTGTAG